MMGIERLDYFLSAVRCGSFTRAAQECGVVPSTISQQIASLEKEVGFSLFARKGRGVVLTRQGELFYQKAHLRAHVLERVNRRHREVAALMPRTVTEITLFVIDL